MERSAESYLHKKFKKQLSIVEQPKPSPPATVVSHHNNSQNEKKENDQNAQTSTTCQKEEEKNATNECRTVNANSRTDFGGNQKTARSLEAIIDNNDGVPNQSTNNQKSYIVSNNNNNNDKNDTNSSNVNFININNSQHHQSSISAELEATEQQQQPAECILLKQSVVSASSASLQQQSCSNANNSCISYAASAAGSCKSNQPDDERVPHFTKLLRNSFDNNAEEDVFFRNMDKCEPSTSTQSSILLSTTTTTASNLLYSPTTNATSTVGLCSFPVHSDRREPCGAISLITNTPQQNLHSVSPLASSEDLSRKSTIAEDNAAQLSQQQQQQTSSSMDKSPSGKYVCTYCNLVCSKPSVLQKHIRAHTNERPFPCNSCGFSFKTRSNLYKHCRSRTHANRVMGNNNNNNNKNQDFGAGVGDMMLSNSQELFQMGEPGSPPSDSFINNNNMESAGIDDRTDNLDFRNKPYKPRFHTASKHLFAASSSNLVAKENLALQEDSLEPGPDDCASRHAAADSDILSHHINEIISKNNSIVNSNEALILRKRSIDMDNGNNDLIYRARTDSLYSLNHGVDEPLNLTNKNRKRCMSEVVEPLVQKSLIKELLLKNLNSDMQCPHCKMIFQTVTELELHKLRSCKGFVKSGAKYSRSSSVNVASILTQNKNAFDNIPHLKNAAVFPLKSPGPFLGKTRLVESDKNKSFSFDDNLPFSSSPSGGVAGHNREKLISLGSDKAKVAPVKMFGGEVKITHTTGEIKSFKIENKEVVSPGISSGGDQRFVEYCGKISENRLVKSGLQSGCTVLTNKPTNPSVTSQDVIRVYENPHETLPASSPALPGPGELEKPQNLASAGGGFFPQSNTNQQRTEAASSSTYSYTNIMDFSQKAVKLLTPNLKQPNLAIPGLPVPSTTSKFSFDLKSPTTDQYNSSAPRESLTSKPGNLYNPMSLLVNGKVVRYVPGIPGPVIAPVVEHQPMDMVYTNSSTGGPIMSTRRSPTPMVMQKPVLLSPLVLKDNQIGDGNNARNSSISTAPKEVRIFFPPTSVQTAASTSPASGNDRPNSDAQNNVETGSGALRPNSDFSQPNSRHKLTVSKSPGASDNRPSSSPLKQPTVPSLSSSSTNDNSARILQESRKFSPSPSSSSTNDGGAKIPQIPESRKFARPNSLALKPTTASLKQHHGLTPTMFNQILISPDTPRVAKKYVQQFLHGNYFSYLGLKCSTKPVYCTLNKTQPYYVPFVPHFKKLSMYSEWRQQDTKQDKIYASAYDSRQRQQSYTMAGRTQANLVVHSSYKFVASESSGKSEKNEDQQKNGGSIKGGYECNDDYTYIRGRGRGRFVCDQCGIRCKKPSMLKKHIRTHSNDRPYTCNHCNFSFKTKGNLTKHMKSKAHTKNYVATGSSSSSTQQSSTPSSETDTEDSGMDSSDESTRREEHEAAYGLLSLSRKTSRHNNNNNNMLEEEEEEQDEENEEDEEEYDEEEEDGCPSQPNRGQSTNFPTTANNNNNLTHNLTNSPATTTNINNIMDTEEIAYFTKNNYAKNKILNEKNLLTNNSSTASKHIPLEISLANNNNNNNNSNNSYQQQYENNDLMMARETQETLMNFLGKKTNTEHNRPLTYPYTTTDFDAPTSSLAVARQQAASSAVAREQSVNNRSPSSISPAMPSVNTNDSLAENDTKKSIKQFHVIQKYAPKAEKILVVKDVHQTSISAKFDSNNSPRQQSFPSVSMTSDSPSSQQNWPTLYYQPQMQQQQQQQQQHQQPMKMGHQQIPQTTPILRINDADFSSSDDNWDTNPPPPLPPPPKIQQFNAADLRKRKISIVDSSYCNNNINSDINSSSSSRAKILRNNDQEVMDLSVEKNCAEQLFTSAPGNNSNINNNNIRSGITMSPAIDRNVTEQFTTSTAPINVINNSDSNIRSGIMLSPNKVKSPAPHQIVFVASVSQPKLLLKQQHQQRDEVRSSDVNSAADFNVPRKLFPTNEKQAASAVAAAAATVYTGIQKSFEDVSDRVQHNLGEDDYRSNGLTNYPGKIPTNSKNNGNISGIIIHSATPPTPNFPPNPSYNNNNNNINNNNSNNNISSSSSIIPSENQKNNIQNFGAPQTKPSSPLNTPLVVTVAAPSGVVITAPELSQMSPNTSTQIPPASSTVQQKNLISSSSKTADYDNSAMETLADIATKQVKLEKNTLAKSVASGILKIATKNDFHNNHLLPTSGGGDNNNKQPMRSSGLGGMSAGGGGDSSSSIGVGGATRTSSKRGTPTPPAGGGFVPSNTKEANDLMVKSEGNRNCAICSKSFSKPSQLRLHMNIHYLERPFRCHSCSVSFRTKGHLQKHERSASHHNKLSSSPALSSSEPRPFKCNDCSIAFRIHGHLAKHLRSKMHIMKLECLAKIPFGLYAELERSNSLLTEINTADGDQCLESLKTLAQKVFINDPSKLTNQPSPVMADVNSDS